MKFESLTEQEAEWFLHQLKPAPKVFLLAYAGGHYKEWKFVKMLTEEEWESKDKKYWIEKIKQLYPSVVAYKIYMVGDEK